MKIKDLPYDNTGHADHWDGNRKNNGYGNLRILCLNCHRHKTKLQKSSELPDEIKHAHFRDYPLKPN